MINKKLQFYLIKDLVESTGEDQTVKTWGDGADAAVPWRSGFPRDGVCSSLATGGLVGKGLPQLGGSAFSRRRETGGRNPSKWVTTPALSAGGGGSALLWGLTLARQMSQALIARLQRSFG